MAPTNGNRPCLANRAYRIQSSNRLTFEGTSMRPSFAIAFLLVGSIRFALAQENTKSFTYAKTKEANLEIIVHFPPGWKESDKRPGIVFFFGGGWENGTTR